MCYPCNVFPFHRKVIEPVGTCFSESQRQKKNKTLPTYLFNYKAHVLVKVSYYLIIISGTANCVSVYLFP